MCIRLLLTSVTALLMHWLVSFAPAAEVPSRQQTAFFESRIRPVLIEHCYECHSAETKSLKGGLRLDLSATLRAGGDSGPAVVPGDATQSLLIAALRYETLEMPPRGKLPQQVIADFTKWVEMGAPDPRAGESVSSPPPKATRERNDHWAFQPIADPPLPRIADHSWPHGETDIYLLKRLESASLRPANDADRFVWLRRVSFDLTGLPPTIEEIRQFRCDDSPTAYDTVVDRLLASRAYGERWARHWLDLVGYADQIGTSNDLFAEHAWRYRDYLVDSFNGDKPVDQMIREQIAGDLLEYDSVTEHASGITATGFLVLGDLEVVEADKEKMRVDIVDQQVVKVTNAFLGLTVGCARCHDHKFDPIPQRDYYALAGFFFNTESVFRTHRGVWSDVHAVELPESMQQVAAREQRIRQHESRVAQLRNERTQASERRQEVDRLLETCELAEESAESNVGLANERNELSKTIANLEKAIEHAEYFAPSATRTYSVRETEQPTEMHITIRGNPRALGEAVPRGFLQATGAPEAVIPSQESGRKQLAEWIVSDDNPLTARVTVNRIWQKLIGFGLVRSVDYFGLRGERPSHPELLDHLATQFMAEGWSQKRLIRAIVLSRAYRMSGTHSEQAHSSDPDNRLLWRMHRRRLDAEAIRDAMLTVSGVMHPSSGGPSLPLEFPENVANIDPKNVNPPSFRLTTWRPEQPFQRTIYLPVLRSAAQPGPAELRNIFDFTQPALFTGQRPVTAVPTQALFLMNSPAVKRVAKQLAERIERQATKDLPKPDLLWLSALNRPITNDERAAVTEFLAGGSGDSWVELCHAILASNEFLVRL